MIIWRGKPIGLEFIGKDSIPASSSASASGNSSCTGLGRSLHLYGVGNGLQARFFFRTHGSNSWTSLWRSVFGPYAGSLRWSSCASASLWSWKRTSALCGVYAIRSRFGSVSIRWVCHSFRYRLKWHKNCDTTTWGSWSYTARNQKMAADSRIRLLGDLLEAQTTASLRFHVPKLL